MSDARNTLPDVPGGWCEEVVEVGRSTVRLMRPAEPELILDDPATLRENEQNDYMPYWCWLWPAAVEMAKAVHRIPLPKGVPILEVGAGLGVVGLAALQAGFEIVISDYRMEAVQVARFNTRLNGFDPDVMQLDWREPVVTRYACVLACDVLYEVVNHQPILDFADAILTTDGVAWIGDPGRQRAIEFIDLARQKFEIELFDANVHAIDELGLNRFNLIRLTRKPE